MKPCPECGVGLLRVTHTYTAIEGKSSTRTKRCTECGQRYTEVLQLEKAEKRGQGAAAVASRIRQKAIEARYGK
jgi:transcriptional regulator NrdR family protein